MICPCRPCQSRKANGRNHKPESQAACNNGQVHPSVQSMLRHTRTVRLISSLGFPPVVSKLWRWRCSQKDGSLQTAPREVSLAPNPPSGKRCFPPESYLNLFFLGPLRSICRSCCC